MGRVRRILITALLAGVGLVVASPDSASAAPLPMLITIDLSKGAGTVVKLPLNNGASATEFIVDWDVGNIAPACPAQTFTIAAGLDALTNTDVSCDYGALVGLKTISITPTGTNTIAWFGGDFPTTGAAKFTGVTQWGDLGLTSLWGAFRGMTNFTTVPAALPATVFDLTYTFAGATSFNGVGVTTWDTSTVTSMIATFQGATSFDQDISTWKTTNVTSMSSMFEGASSFNKALNYDAVNQYWNTSNVTDMAAMFSGATVFNGNITDWITSNVTSMPGMFASARAFNQPIGGWDTSNVTNMNGMFGDARAFNQPLAAWDTSAVTNMAYMFSEALVFDQPLGGWDTSNVTDMSNMFYGTPEFNQNLSAWNVGSLLNTTNMFRVTTKFNNGAAPGTCNVRLDWADSANLVNTAGMFAFADGFDAELVLDTSNVTTMQEMFFAASVFNNGCFGPALPVTNRPLNLDTSSVTTFREMFWFASAFNQNVNLLDTNAATDVVRMFRGASAFNNGCAAGVFTCPLTFVLSGGGRSLISVTQMEGMLQNASAFNQNVNTFDTSKVANMATVFYGAGEFNNGCGLADVSCPLQWDTSQVTKMSEMFLGASKFNQNISFWNVRKVTDMVDMFQAAALFDQNLSAWCFDGAVAKAGFESGSGFELLVAKHPSWAACPFNAFVPTTTTTPPTTTVPPDSTTPPDSTDPGSDGPDPTLPVTGPGDDAPIGVALVIMAIGWVVLASRRTVRTPR